MHSITFFNDKKEVLATYQNITYKKSQLFTVDVTRVEFLTVKIKQTIYRTVILGIGDAVLIIQY